MREGGILPESHSDDLSLLKEALDRAADISLACLPVAELLERACELQRLSSRLDSIRAATLAAAESAADAPGVLRELGYRTPTQVVAANAGAKADDVRPLAKAGSWLIDFPVFRQAFADGTFTLRHVRDLKALDKPCTRHGLIEAQDYLVDLARNGDYRTFRQGLAYWLTAADPDGDEPREQVAKTGCRITRNGDGSMSGEFYLDRLSAAAVGNALEDEAQRIFNRQNEEAGTADTPRQRRGQALVHLMIKGAGVPGSATTTPLVDLIMGWELYQNLIERLDDSSVEPVEVDVNDPNRRCELIDGTPIHPNLALMVMAVAEFKRIVVDTKSLPIDVSVKARCHPPWMKELLLIIARGRCRTLGCSAPYSWLLRVCPRQTRGGRAEHDHTPITSCPTPRAVRPASPMVRYSVVPTTSGSGTSLSRRLREHEPGDHDRDHRRAGLGAGSRSSGPSRACCRHSIPVEMKGRGEMPY